MTLKFIQTLKNEIESLLPDNSVGLITPATLRSVLQDMTDSLYNRAGVLFRASVAFVPQALTTVPTNYPAIYDTLRAPDPAVITGNVVAGTVTPNATGFGIYINPGITVAGANGRVVTGVVAKNGVQIEASRISVTCSGVGNKETATLTLPVIGITAGDVFTLLLSVDTNAVIDIYQQVLNVQIVPTFSST